LDLRLCKEHLDRQIAEITQPAAQPGIPDEQKLALPQTRQELRESKRAPLIPRVADNPASDSDHPSTEDQP